MWSKYSRMSFYDWEGVVIYDKEPEETIILQRSGNHFNKLARAPLPQQPVSTSRLVQDFNKRKWFTKEIPRTQKCLMGGGEEEKLALVYHLGYTCFSRGEGFLAKGRTLKNSHCCKIPILTDSLWPWDTVKSFISLEPHNYLLRQSKNYAHFVDRETEA